MSKIVTMRVQVFAKGAKFSMFKPAEEMVYIGLDEESRTKGKAAIDVVGAQSGKSAGSILQQVTPLSLLCTCCKYQLSASMLSGGLSLEWLKLTAHQAHFLKCCKHVHDLDNNTLQYTEVLSPEKSLGHDCN